MEVRHLLILWKPPPAREIVISFGEGVTRAEAADVLLQAWLEISGERQRAMRAAQRHGDPSARASGQMG